VIAWNVGDGNNEKPLTPNLERNIHGVQVTDDDIPSDAVPQTETGVARVDPVR
jgi:hypothetical protein